MKKIVVIGSINVDLITSSSRFCKVGETIMADTFQQAFGGKGSNQAVAASKLGGNVTMIGCVGQDEYGASSIDNLKKNKIQTDCIKIIPDVNTGLAVIVVAENDNQIYVISGANQSVTKDVISENISIIEEAEYIMIQLEIPLPSIQVILDLSRQYKKKVIFNPAPFKQFDLNWIDQVTYITPNQTEIEAMFPTMHYEDVLKKYPNKMIMTAGSDGSYYYNGKELVHVPAFKVNQVVDTTGAGDTFHGAFAVALVEGKELYEAIEYGCKAASIAISGLGAQTAMPTKKDM